LAIVASPGVVGDHPLDVEFVANRLLIVQRPSLKPLAPRAYPDGTPRVFCRASALVTGSGRTGHQSYGQLLEEVEAIEVHDLVPRGHEVSYELLLGVVTRVDLRDGPELGVPTEGEIHGGGGPPGLARAAVATLVHVLRRVRSLPLRAHVEQVDEEVV